MKVGGSRTSTTATSGRSVVSARSSDGPVVHGFDDLEVVRFEQPDQPVPEEGEIFGEDDAHGSTIVTVGRSAGRTYHRERAVEGGEPPLDAAQPGARGRVGAADAVVGRR